MANVVVGGNDPIDRPSAIATGYTYIDKNNPISDTCTLVEVQVYFTNATGGTYPTKLIIFRDNGTQYVPIGYTDVGAVHSSGYVSYVINIAVQAGDYVGWYTGVNAGVIDRTDSGGSSAHISGDYSETTVDKTSWTNSARILSVRVLKVDTASTSTITADSHIKAVGVQASITSDSMILGSKQTTIAADSNIVIGVIKDAINYFNSIKRIFKDVNVKFNSVIRSLKDVENKINTCYRVLADVINDFRTQRRELYDALNDIRFIQSWQKPASLGFQSRGKEYIKVYIDSVEQTLADIDSIVIDRLKNAPSSASFVLAQAYDSSKPTDEAFVEIKYNDWLLYSGYITAIVPSEDPEGIRIECQDKYWKDNKVNKYYHVGHKPIDNTEKYYDTIKDALSTEHSWALTIGNFVPQSIDCFAQGQSDCMSKLISEAGNFAWFYDVNENKILWEAGAGSVIKIRRQAIGQNLDLYDLINHSFSETVTDIVNKFRVQMGDKVIRSTGSRTYTGYNYASYHQFVTPAWNPAYETLARNSGTGYGIDYHKSEDDQNYKDVFRKFNMPFLDARLSSWSDRYPPYVEIYETDWLLFNAPAAVLKDGFTIDYEKGTITFNDPIFLFKADDRGMITAIRAPLVKVFLWKKNYYTYTSSPTDNPEVDISNPLMFFTDKMGTYPDTILKELSLSDLSIQVGTAVSDAGSNTETQTYGGGVKKFTMAYTGLTSMYIMVNGVELSSSNYSYNSSEGTVTITSSLTTEDFIYFAYNYSGIQIIPSWDDTNFALDFADWQLSKICDKKINGNIEITLDAFCFYEIDLNKRIFIDGITDTAMNIEDAHITISDFKVNISLKNSRSYTRTISLPSRER